MKALFFPAYIKLLALSSQGVEIQKDYHQATFPLHLVYLEITFLDFLKEAIWAQIADPQLYIDHEDLMLPIQACQGDCFVPEFIWL